MAITTEAGLKTAIAWARELYFNKASQTAEGAGTWHSLWKATGMPAPGINPPAYTANSEFRPTSATTGAISMANAGASKALILTEARLLKASVGAIVAYDRLWACSGFDTNVTTTQTITYGATYPVNRGPANGVAVEPWFEVYTPPGPDGGNWTVNFQDQALGGVGSATYFHPGANAETTGQMMPMIMAAGTQSVYYPIDFTCQYTSQTAGDIGITLMRPIAILPIREANIDQVFGFLDTCLAAIENDACVALMIRCNTTSTGIVEGRLQVAES